MSQIFRVERTKNYTVMSNHHFKNKSLSLKAKGVLSLMLSLPDNWNYNISISELNRIYEQLEELPDYLLDDLDSFVSYYGSLEELVEHKDDIILYSGCETMTDLAYYLIDEEQSLGEILSSLQNYIDYEAYGRDLDIEGTFIATNAGIFEVLRIRTLPPLIPTRYMKKKSFS